MRLTYRQGWTAYRGAMISHHVQGGVAALMILLLGIEWQIIGCLWALLYISYQALTLIRKRDAAGLDVLDFMVGMFGVAFIVLPIQLIF